MLQVITDYAYALNLLDRYDYGTLSIEKTSATADFILDYAAGSHIVQLMKGDFDGLFGIEKDQGFKNGSKRLADNALVALTLLIAESKPEEKDTIVKVVVNLINRCNG